MIRRYTPLRARTRMRRSRGTVIPPAVRRHVRVRDAGCIGPRIGMPGECFGAIELDHVRASGALGKKSRSTPDNLVSLCSLKHHRLKTERGREWRPRLLDYIARRDAMGR